MYKTKATIALGALLSAGMLLAQAPDNNQAPTASEPQVTQTQPGNAQRTHRHMADPHRLARRMGKKLGLSREQVAQITPILANRRQQMRSLRADATLSKQDRHAKARALALDANSKIESLLNNTQKQQFEQMLAQRHSHHNHQPQA